MSTLMQLTTDYRSYLYRKIWEQEHYNHLFMDTDHVRIP
jgi:hypothetical protein